MTCLKRNTACAVITSVFTVLTCLLQCRAAEGNVIETPFDAVVDDIRNASEVEWSVINEHRNAGWVQAAIVASPESGALISGSTAFDIGTGKTVTVPGGRDVAHFDGTINVLAELSKGVKSQKISYLWDVPNPYLRDHGLPDRRIPFNSVAARLRNSEIFYKGGVAILNIGNGVSKPEDILAVYILPQKWESSALAASQYFANHRDLFDPSKVQSNVGFVAKELENINPVVAVEACRLLARAGKLRPVDLLVTHQQTDVLEQAVFVLNYLRAISKSPNNAGLGDLTAFIKAAHDTPSLQGMALGAVVAMFSREPSLMRAGFILSDTIDKKMNAIGTDDDAKRYLKALYKYADLESTRAMYAE